MILYANGCSMTWGAELADDGNQQCIDDNYREMHAWPGVFGRLLDADFIINEAIGGGSNDRIIRTTISRVSKFLEEYDAKDIFVAIAWSSPDRREFCSNKHIRLRSEPWRQLLANLTEQDTQTASLHSVYYKHFWNDVESTSRYITQVLSLQSYLSLLGVRYIFCDAISAHTEDELLKHGHGSLVQRIDRRRYYQFGSKEGNMHAVIANLKCPTAPRGHPLEEGHIMWAETLKRHMEEYNL